MDGKISCWKAFLVLEYFTAAILLSPVVISSFPGVVFFPLPSSSLLWSLENKKFSVLLLSGGIWGGNGNEGC